MIDRDPHERSPPAQTASPIYSILTLRYHPKILPMTIILSGHRPQNADSRTKHRSRATRLYTVLMRDDRRKDLQTVSLRDLRAAVCDAGAGRAFRRGLRRRIPLLAKLLLVTSQLMVVLGFGSIFGFDLLLRLFDIELQPTYRIYSFRWWADELVKACILLGVPLLLISTPAYYALRNRVSLRASTAIELGFCGGCGYALRGLVPEQDGCVVCPECQAAWRISHGYAESVDVPHCSAARASCTV